LDPEQQKEVIVGGYRPRVHRYNSNTFIHEETICCYHYSDIKNDKTESQFTQNELQTLLECFTNNGDVRGVLRIIKSAKTNEIVLNIGNLLLPLETIPAVIFYLVAIRSTELSTLLARLRQHENDFEIETAIRAATFKEFMADMGPIKKSELRRICQIWNRFNVSESVDRQLLFDFPIQKLSVSTTKPRKLAFVVIFIGLLLSSVKSIPPTFPSTLLIKLHLFWSILPPLILARTLQALAERCCGTRAAKDVLKFVNAFASTCDSRSREFGILLRIFSLLGKPQIISIDMNVCFLNSLIPSLFMTGLRLFDEVLRTLPEKSHSIFLKNILPIVLSVFPNFLGLPGVSEAFSLPITSVFLRKNLRPFHNEIVTAMRTFLVGHSHASFIPSTFGIPTAIRACSNNSSDLRFLCDVGDSINTEPACVSLIIPTLQMLRERAYKSETSRQREAFMVEKINEWFGECEIGRAHV
jgi:hypothetical protein